MKDGAREWRKKKLKNIQCSEGNDEPADESYVYIFHEGPNTRSENELGALFIFSGGIDCRYPFRWHVSHLGKCDRRISVDFSVTQKYAHTRSLRRRRAERENCASERASGVKGNRENRIGARDREKEIKYPKYFDVLTFPSFLIAGAFSL